MSILDSRLPPLEELQEAEALSNEKLADEIKKLNKSNKVEAKKKKTK